MQRGIPCTMMRGGTSKGLFFRSDALPADVAARDRVLLAAMGSPDIRQIDGLGGAHPLTSKVAVIRPATRDDADVDYLFLQVAVDQPLVSDSQNCGNMLAGVGPWAIENGLVRPRDGTTSVRIHMVNTASVAVAHVLTPAGRVQYEGRTRIDGVPGTAAKIAIDFLDVAGSSCGALLPTGAAVDRINGIDVTCIDNGMPVVVVSAADVGKSGRESPGELEADAALVERIEALRLKAGALMNLGDVTRKTVPKMSLVSSALGDGTLNTRTFIPHRVHEAIGVLGAVSVATACAIPGTVANRAARGRSADAPNDYQIEHPTGFFTVTVEIDDAHDPPRIRRAALVRTARKLMTGELFVPAHLWSAA
jgi:4-oxalomesaconate tautomerase